MKNNLLRQLFRSPVFYSAILAVIGLILSFIIDSIIPIAIAALYLVALIIISFINAFKDFSKGKHAYIKKGKKRPTKAYRWFFRPVFNNITLDYDYEFAINEYKYDDDKYNSYLHKLPGFSATIFPRIRKYDKKYSNNAISPFFKKLGLSFILPHHWSSFRFAWKMDEEKIDTYTYQYLEGKLYMKKIIVIPGNEFINLSIRSRKGYMFFRNEYNHCFTTPHKFTLGYRLGFYMLDEIGAAKNLYIFFKKNK